VTTPVLTIELVPKTAWFSNLRSELTPSQWTTCKNFVRKRSGDRCEICGGRGPRWPVECHEIWNYVDVTRVQRLDGLIALCPDCHMVKHIGMAEVRGLMPEALMHLMKVNEWDEGDAYQYVALSFQIWAERSRYDWDLDISWLEAHLRITPGRCT
jgi:hypothetical protein